MSDSADFTANLADLTPASHQWEAMGTVWYIATFGRVPDDLWQDLEHATAEFEAKYSRFLPQSEVNAWRHISEPVTAHVSPQLAEMLRFAQLLKTETDGLFDPAVGGLLEEIGYDATYSFRPNNPQDWHAPNWSFAEPNLITLSEPIVIDVGGFGKGFWIDQLSTQLTAAGFPFHLVDGGGDMFATTKPDGSPWRVAVEQPGQPDVARDVVSLKHQALAVSDTVKRHWGQPGSEWHHVLNPVDRTNAQRIQSAAVIAPTAMVADGLTTALMVSEPEKWLRLAQNFQATYSLLDHENHTTNHPEWGGEMLDK